MYIEQESPDATGGHREGIPIEAGRARFDPGDEEDARSDRNRRDGE